MPTSTIIAAIHLISINKAMIASAHGAEFRLHYVSADGQPFGQCRTFFTREALDIAIEKECSLDAAGTAFGPHI